MKKQSMELTSVQNTVISVLEVAYEMLESYTVFCVFVVKK